MILLHSLHLNIMEEAGVVLLKEKFKKKIYLEIRNSKICIANIANYEYLPQDFKLITPLLKI